MAAIERMVGIAEIFSGSGIELEERGTRRQGLDCAKLRKADLGLWCDVARKRGCVEGEVPQIIKG